MYDRVTMQVGADVANMRVRVKAQTAAVKMQVAGGGAGVARDAETAKRLATPREIALAGAAQGGAFFDSSEDVAIYTALETLTNEELEEMLR